MGNRFANGEQCRRRGQQVAVSRWADQRHPWNWLSRSVCKVQPPWCCLPRHGGLLTDALGGNRRRLGCPGWSRSARGGRRSRDTTPLGAMWLCTLGSPWDGPADGRRFGGTKRRHDSKICQRLAMFSTWEMLVGGGAPVSAPATCCNPWMILSSKVRAGIARYLWRNSTGPVSEMHWLLVSVLTSLKHRYKSRAGPI